MIRGIGRKEQRWWEEGRWRRGRDKGIREQEGRDASKKVAGWIGKGRVTDRR